MERISILQLLISLLCFSVLIACREHQIVPTAEFSYTLADPGLSNYLSVYPVSYAIKTTNNSTNASSYLWDFGDGNSSTQQTPTFSYAKAGTYTITLTTTSSTGTQQVSKKSIQVVDQVLKRITVNQLNWNAFGELPTWTGGKRADLTIELGQRPIQSPPSTPSVVLYQSEPLKNVSNTNVAFEIPVTKKVVLNPAQINNLLLNLYGNDGNGSQLVYSSGGAGIGYSSYFDITTRYRAFL
ncbi:PKD domain-containing protein [Spirosoma soli]|uniref:PKD domain-containing protein n=1 Tax=Spirosoma soli TaxID=1770529 RepID=A0ABW5MGG7_9BACT